jgi:F-type H+-transporting ATPase subunit a
VFWDTLHLLSPIGSGAHQVLAGDPGGPLWLLPHIDVTPETLFTIPGINLPVTNTLIAAYAATFLVSIIFLAATRRMKIVPKGFQNFVEWAAGLLMDFCEEVAGKEWGRRLFPFIGTIFFLVLFSNWVEVIPGVDSIGTPAPGVHPVAGIFLIGNDSDKLTSWIRPASSDLNFTLTLALISVIVTQIYGFRTLGFRLHVGKYINFHGPVNFFVGILEIISELARIISFSFRLFGNVFAGDVLLVVLGTLLPWVGATVFYPLELFVGFIQAFVFAALTLVFISLAITTHDEGEHATEHAEAPATHS